MVKIKAEIELDRAVLSALGAVYRENWQDEVGCCKMSGYYYPDGTVACRESIPRYSEDLNAAFSAAEKVGLFDYYYLMRADEQWEIRGQELFASASTVALVICEAILKLKESL